MRMTPALLAIALALSAGAQQPAGQAALDHLTVVAQDYFRGLTENLLDVSEEIRSYNRGGKLLRTEYETHGWGISSGLFVGLSEGAEWDYDEFWRNVGVDGDRGSLSSQAVRITDANTLTPWFALSPQARGSSDFELSGTTGATIAVVSFRSREPCAAFRPASETDVGFDGFRITERSCGSGQSFWIKTEQFPFAPGSTRWAFPQAKEF